MRITASLLTLFSKTSADILSSLLRDITKIYPLSVQGQRQPWTQDTFGQKEGLRTAAHFLREKSFKYLQGFSKF